MKLWVNMTIAVVVATTAAAWADIGDLNLFGFRSANVMRKQPKRSYAAELLKNNLPSNEPLVAEVRPQQKRVRVQVASVIKSDADQSVALQEPIVLNNLSLVKPEPKPSPWNRVVVGGLVAETGWHGGMRIRECDRAVEEKFAGDPPAVVECQAKGSDTVYSATTARRDEDYRRKNLLWNLK